MKTFKQYLETKNFPPVHPGEKTMQRTTECPYVGNAPELFMQ